MAKIERSALVLHSCEQLFALVNDVARYPEFMPGCVAAEVLAQSESELTARLTLARAGLRHSFVTRNSLVPPSAMDMALVAGPFRRLAGHWRFQPLGELGCKVSLSLEFELASGLLARAAGPLFEAMAGQQVDALVKRAQQLYGGQAGPNSRS